MGSQAAAVSGWGSHNLPYEKPQHQEALFTFNSKHQLYSFHQQTPFLGARAPHSKSCDSAGLRKTDHGLLACGSLMCLRVTTTSLLIKTILITKTLLPAPVTACCCECSCVD
eukprot:TRINITY_DN7418_c0_g1_i5.p1 TRINITY_DN7418_c0_g1~~TRINITY_DN7418_c0_g1_i5.p1  ORF type:complete len:127 (-),score=58.16 TRINITY_DN7418_c0_g1_i5:245-580(-)